MYDFEEIFQATIAVIEEAAEKNAPIYLNISSAPKLTLVAMLSATLMMRNMYDVNIFYVAPQHYILSDILHNLKTLEETNKEDSIQEYASAIVRDESIIPHTRET